ncbi:Site-specific DNA recombinase [Altererythrobacter xiamenensis]|uniref:Site-specific DNA recombinase n=2 Tax=Altererythrobacter xiamenensis TaxID=1316679 RepID=A0A1Y6ETX9_9SPHN|nr:Site-specific DNA recombinase [Altererythrobacter xiamenensis]
MKTVRCAIYTRKSTEDGLEQEFNSLDAQREACEAFICSQKHEGWELIERSYDDGGFSGGNMDRPGLKELLAEVDAGQVDVIVVYKVDRLTRSLADFAKIVERLDAKEASFVSVTQAFNTTTSMGRLTLNVLLSFAQFDREVTSERIRDKIAASKKKGLWMGGPVPLGYQAIERKLVPVEEEAQRVRHIMQRYLALPSAPALLDELAAEGIVTKVQKRVSGPHRGGIPFQRGSLFHLLKNPVYRGKIVHKGKAYEGEHRAIVDEALWDAVQAKLRANAPPRRAGVNKQNDALLVGRLTDPQGRPMVPTFACKGTRRYRYYETRRDLAAPDQPKATRYPMRQLDRHVVDALKTLLSDEHAIRRLFRIDDAATLERALKDAGALANNLQNEAVWREPIGKILASIQVEERRLVLSIRPEGLGLDGAGGATEYAVARLRKKPFREPKLRLDAPADHPGKPDASLVKLLRQARDVQSLVLGQPDKSLLQLAQQEGRCRKQLTKLLRISWLSPEIVEAICDGRQPKRLTRNRLMNADLPLDWQEQAFFLGFSASS